MRFRLRAILNTTLIGRKGRKGRKRKRLRAIYRVHKPSRRRRGKRTIHYWRAFSRGAKFG